ncbi:MAG: AAA family ATPase [Nitrospinae bacterium]|nr:AAA family ATPase [Nitrospinota bacterium]
MKLTKVRITEFQSIWDSTEFDIGDVTCLVGKNEAGKTALLKALYRLNPIIEEDGSFDVTLDYPRRAVSEYKDDVEAGRREPTTVVQATYALEPEDITAIQEVFGPQCFQDETPTLTLHKGYSDEDEDEDGFTFSDLNVDKEAAIKHLVEASGLSQTLINKLLDLETIEEMVKALDEFQQDEDEDELQQDEDEDELQQDEAVQKLMLTLKEVSEQDVAGVAYNRILEDRIPKFLYFDEYYQMEGQDNVDGLKERVANRNLKDSDHPLLGLIELAGLKLDQLTDPDKTEDLLARLEAAETRLTNRVLTYWSQNRHLSMKFDIRPGLPGDPDGMTSGMNIWGRVHDTRHMVSTALGTRSRGFVWFFSFLAWYSRKKDENIILLLDEPGLSLHAKAQADLLRYFEEELKPHHQLIYTTHSPFMVDSTRFDRVRIVQDLGIEPDSDNLSEEQEGTKVITEVLDATPDSLFPLQGALGYEIYQTLFIGPNCLVVEGVSDLLYIQTISAILQANGKEGLSSDWTITPVGGSDKVPTFVALIGAQTDLNLAVLIDYQNKDRQKIEYLYRRRLLLKKNVLTYANYVQGSEADIEDIFEPEFYLKLVKEEFGVSISLTDLSSGHPRILRRLKEYLASNPLPNNETFNHFRPARYLSENIGCLESELSEQELDQFEQVFKDLNALL